MKKICLVIIMVLAFGMLAGCGDSPQNGAANGSNGYNGAMNTEGLERVGEAEFGFVYIPEDWTNFTDVGFLHGGIAHIGFKSLEGTTLNIINHGVVSGIEDMLKSHVTNAYPDFATITLDGRTAFRAQTAFAADGFYLYTWYFSDENEYFRIITAEGAGEEIKMLVELVERTFSLSE